MIEIFLDFSTKEEVDIHILCLRNEYYRQNEILRKDSFTREDEIEIEKWLRRTKHPLLLRAHTYMPTENLVKWNGKREATKKERVNVRPIIHAIK